MSRYSWFLGRQSRLPRAFTTLDTSRGLDSPPCKCSEQWVVGVGRDAPEQFLSSLISGANDDFRGLGRLRASRIITNVAEDKGKHENLEGSLVSRLPSSYGVLNLAWGCAVLIPASMTSDLREILGCPSIFVTTTPWSWSTIPI